MLDKIDKLQLGLATQMSMTNEFIKLVTWITDNEIISEVGNDYINKSLKKINNMSNILNKEISVL